MSEASAALKELLFPDMEEAQRTNAFESTVPVFPPDGVIAKETWDETIEMIRGAPSETDHDNFHVDEVVHPLKRGEGWKRHHTGSTRTMRQTERKESPTHST